MTYSICGVSKRTAFANIVTSLVTSVTLVLVAGSAYGQSANDAVNPNATAATVSSADWTQFHGDNMQRWNPYETLLGVNNAPTLQLKWVAFNTFFVGMGSFQSSAAVANGMFFMGSDDDNIYALDAATGVTLWTYRTGGEVISSPAAVNGVVYVGSLDHNVYALNSRTGSKLWSYTTGDAVESSPTVMNGVVYIGSQDGNVYALDARNGAKLWNYTTGDPRFAPPPVFSSPAVVNGVAYVGSNDGNLYALNATTGAKLWNYTTANAVGSSPAVANGVVYFGSDDGNVYALDAKTGAKLWSISLGNYYLNSSPAVANGVVYIGSGAGGHLYALNANTGATLWSFAEGHIVDSSPALANGVVYFGSEGGTIYALNATTGARLWSYSTNTNVNFSPTVVNGTVYFSTGGYSGGGIYAFSVGADLFLRVAPSVATVHPGDLLTFAFPVWNLGPENASHEVLNTQVPAGTVFDYVRISGTPGLGTCTTPPYQGTGQIVCHENASMGPNTTWTVRLTVKVTAAAGATITENAATVADTPDPNMPNNMATASVKVQ